MKLLKFVQRKRALGDVLWIEPVIRQLALEYRFVFVTTIYADIFKNYPYKNVYFRKKQNPVIKFFRLLSKALFRSYGFLDLDNVYEKNPKMHILKAYYNAAGYSNLPLSYPIIYPTFVKKNILRTKNVVLHLNAPSKKRNFRTIDGIDWVRIKNYFEERNYCVIGISDDPSDKHFYTEMRTPTLQELITIIDECELFIGLDSGPSHIAASRKKQSILFFGSVNPSYRHLMDEFNGKILQKYCPYAGCYHEFLDDAKRKCLIVEDSVIAPCCRYTTDELLSVIDTLQSV